MALCEAQPFNERKAPVYESSDEKALEDRPARRHGNQSGYQVSKFLFIREVCWINEVERFFDFMQIPYEKWLKLVS